MTQEELLNLKDGRRVVVIETGDNWDRDKIPVVCVKVCDRLIEADLQSFDHIKRNHLPYYDIKEMYHKGYEIEVLLEEEE